MKYILSSLLFFICQLATAQVAINTTGNNPAPSAMLDVSSANKGMLLPRMNSTQRKAIQAPEKGLIVFDTDRETIYFYDGQKWKPMMTATEATAPLASRQPQGGKLFSGFGTSADIYENFAVVGAPSDSVKGVDGGAVYVFIKNGNNWEQVAKLSAPFPQANEGFGRSVSLCGDLLVVGASNKKVNGNTACGAAYVFKRSIRAWNYVATLNANNGAAYDNFGDAVATNGTYAIIGAPYTDHNTKTDAGSVYVFGLQNGAWTQKTVLNAVDPTELAYYGKSVDIWQNKLLVGAPGAIVQYANTNTKSGAAYFYNNTDVAGFTWVLGQKIFTMALHNDMGFGAAVALEGNRLLCGAPNYSGHPQQNTGFHHGGAFHYAFENGSWKQKTWLGENNGEQNRTGISVALTNNALFAGMPNWRDGLGKVMMVNVTLQFFYDEDLNLKRNFGGAVAAHNGQFIITSPKVEPYGRVFFGTVE